VNGALLAALRQNIPRGCSGGWNKIFRLDVGLAQLCGTLWKKTMSKDAVIVNSLSDEQWPTYGHFNPVLVALFADPEAVDSLGSFTILFGVSVRQLDLSMELQRTNLTDPQLLVLCALRKVVPFICNKHFADCSTQFRDHHRSLLVAEPAAQVKSGTKKAKKSGKQKEERGGVFNTPETVRKALGVVDHNVMLNVELVPQWASPTPHATDQVAPTKSCML